MLLSEDFVRFEVRFLAAPRHSARASKSDFYRTVGSRPAGTSCTRCLRLTVSSSPANDAGNSPKTSTFHSGSTF